MRYPHTRGALPAAPSTLRGPDGAARHALPAAGPMSRHLRDVTGLPPDLVRVDPVSFVATVAPDGRVSQPEHVTLHGDYHGELFALGGFGPRGDAAGAASVRWNAREDGRNFNLFTTPLPMAQLASAAGPGPIVEFSRAAYVFRPGARIRLEFSVLPGYVAADPAAFGVTLFLNLIRA